MPNRKCLVVRKVDATLRDSCFALFKDILSQWKIYDQCKINKTDMTIELPNGSIFLFKIYVYSIQYHYGKYPPCFSNWIETGRSNCYKFRR